MNNTVTGEAENDNDSDQLKQENGDIRFTIKQQHYKALVALIQQSNLGDSSSTPHVNQIGTFPQHNVSAVGNVLPFICTTHNENFATWISDSGARSHFFILVFIQYI